MSPPLKPLVCIQGDRLALFIGAAYQLLPLEKAEQLSRDIQSQTAKLRRQHKRAKRALAKTFLTTNETEHQP